MKNFDSFNDWWQCLKSASVHLVKFLWQLLQVVFIGLTSLSCALWRRLARAVGNYPAIALGMFIVIVFLTWMFTFVSMRTRAVGAESQRDRIVWQYHCFKQTHGYE